MKILVCGGAGFIGSAFIRNYLKNHSEDKIINLEPDLVLAFSDIQADIVSELIKKNFTVLCFNQRDINGIFNVGTGKPRSFYDIACSVFKNSNIKNNSFS